MSKNFEDRKKILIRIELETSVPEGFNNWSTDPENHIKHAILDHMDKGFIRALRKYHNNHLDIMNCNVTLKKKFPKSNLKIEGFHIRHKGGMVASGSFTDDNKTDNIF